MLLVIACPCALVLSTPISIVSALAAAARRGVLIKGGLHLERLAAIAAVAVDKTGTLTHGVLSVVDVRPIDGVEASTVLATAAAVAARSPHPVDRAIAAHARHAGTATLEAMAVQAMPGLGIAAQVGGVAVELGSPRHFAARGWLTGALEAQAAAATARGLQVVLVARDAQAIGLVTLGDELKTHARDAIAELRAAGVRHVAMLSGDHAPAAAAAGEASGVDTVAAGLLPEQKVALVHDLAARVGPVAMVGDGVNDAPALAAAHVGIAMGAAGTAAAIETADVALMSDDLRGVALAIRLGRATLSTIRANVAAALAIKAVTVVLAVAGVATLWMAVLADVGGSLIVVANALRLLRTKVAPDAAPGASPGWSSRERSGITPMQDSATCATIRPMQRRLTLLLMAALCAASCGSDEETPPTTPTPGARLAIAPQPDFLTVGSSVVLEARLTEGTSPPRVVPADWSQHGRPRRRRRSQRPRLRARPRQRDDPRDVRRGHRLAGDARRARLRRHLDRQPARRFLRPPASGRLRRGLSDQPHRRDDARPHPGARSRHRHAVAEPAARLAVLRRERHDRRTRQPHAGRHDHLDAVERRLDDARHAGRLPRRDRRRAPGSCAAASPRRAPMPTARAGASAGRSRA